MYKSLDDNGNSIRFEYDTDGNLCKEILGEGGETVYSYNTSGLGLTMTDPEGNVTYNDFTRLQKQDMRQNIHMISPVMLLPTKTVMESLLIIHIPMER